MWSHLKTSKETGVQQNLHKVRTTWKRAHHVSTGSEWRTDYCSILYANDLKNHHLFPAVMQQLDTVCVNACHDFHPAFLRTCSCRPACFCSSCFDTLTWSYRWKRMMDRPSVKLLYSCVQTQTTMGWRNPLVLWKWVPLTKSFEEFGLKLSFGLLLRGSICSCSLQPLTQPDPVTG